MQGVSASSLKITFLDVYKNMTNASSHDFSLRRRLSKVWISKSLKLYDKATHTNLHFLYPTRVARTRALRARRHDLR